MFLRINRVVSIIMFIELLRTVRSFNKFRFRPFTRDFKSFNAAQKKTDVASDYHIPVLRDECCHYLITKENGLYVDCTVGGGGHTRAILERGGRVIGLDQDPDAIAEASSHLEFFISTGKLELIRTNFRFIEKAIKESVLAKGELVDGVLMDLGISSHQIDEPERGFAFGADGPLDMRMGQGQNKNNMDSDHFTDSDFTAATIVNEWDQESIANALYDYGDEPR